MFFGAWFLQQPAERNGAVCQGAVGSKGPPRRRGHAWQVEGSGGGGGEGGRERNNVEWGWRYIDMVSCVTVGRIVVINCSDPGFEGSKVEGFVGFQVFGN